jgi:3-hydroxymyristoyl/3-hydroxydecanoyl-(acyl carrier protein) dehydratase
MSDQSHSLSIPLEHPAYAGHFPGNPIVPGALLLQWLVVLVERGYPNQRLLEVASIKFLAEVKPGDHLDVNIRSVGAGDKLEISSRSGIGPVCKAVFRMRVTGRA